GTARYPHARIIPVSAKQRFIQICDMSSKRGDGTHEGAKTHPDSTLTTDVRQQTAAVLRNIHLVLKVVTSGRGGVSNVIDSTAFITDLEASFTGMNEERNKLSPDPKRTTVGIIS
ncbi:hypothetical protein EDB82DRAFT_420959, partial [Fusarium venenatum]|uniref:uncharacterized protein n=1 Tax=Fusarium venenatum TaxID=56646 RepID=UPI001DD2700A